MSKVATDPEETSKLYPVTERDRARFEAWLDSKLQLDDTGRWIAARLQSAPGSRVLGIAGAQLIFPTFTDSSTVTVADLEGAIARRMGKTSAQIREAEPRLAGPAPPMGGRPFVPWQYLPPLIYAQKVTRLSQYLPHSCCLRRRRPCCCCCHCCCCPLAAAPPPPRE